MAKNSNNPNNIKNSKKIVAITLIALFLMSSAIVMVQGATSTSSTTLPGYTPVPDRDTETNIGVTPTLIGLGQKVTMNVMVWPAPSGPTYYGQNLVSQYNGGFANITVTVTGPDGAKDTFKPVDVTLLSVDINEPGRTQIVGTLMFDYKPAKVGNYSVTASFPGQFYTTDSYSATAKLSVYYKPSETPQATTFTVQEQPVSGGLIDGSPYQPLPTEYWSRPVSTNNREWAVISGDWVQRPYDILGSNYNPYSTAPTTPHIVWSRVVSESGLVGGSWGSLPYPEDAGASASAPGAAIGAVMQGKIFRNTPNGNIECVDLRTGQLLWTAPGTILQGQRMQLPYQTGTQDNEGSVSSWLWANITQSQTGTGATTWVRLSSYDGHVLQTITNVPRDIISVKFDDMSPIAWCTQANLNLWNTSVPMKLPYVNVIKWNFTKLENTVIYTNTYSNNWNDGVVWNVSALTGNTVDIGDNNFRGPTVFPFAGANVVVVRTPNAMQIMAGFDYTTGSRLWVNNATVLNLDVLIEGFATSSNGPLIMRDGASPNFVAYNVKTGQELWRASTGELPWGAVQAYSAVYNDGANYFGSYDGHVYAYNSTSGKQIWASDYIGANTEVIENNNPFNGHAVGAGGVLYFSSATVYNMMPRPRFQEMVGINQSTGKFLYELPIAMMPVAVADGYLLTEDVDNGIQYVVGKGQTATTVTAPDTAVPLGTSIVIKGTVMDMSPGKPNTPAIADADMATWMSYQYGQNATLINSPPSVHGVPVTLSVVDANGNYRKIADITSDGSGAFSFTWKPDIEGTYTLIASFAGSESYWSSYAESAFAVDPAAPTLSPIVTSQQSMADLYFIPAIVGLVVVIIAVGLLTILTLRKRP